MKGTEKADTLRAERDAARGEADALREEVAWRDEVNDELHRQVDALREALRKIDGMAYCYDVGYVGDEPCDPECGTCTGCRIMALARAALGPSESTDRGAAM